MSKEAGQKNVIHYSSIPWINFTSVSYSHNIKNEESVPKITFGKMVSREDKKIMPVSIYVHHGLMDGLHVGKYLEMFQKLMDEQGAVLI